MLFQSTYVFLSSYILVVLLTSCGSGGPSHHQESTAPPTITDDISIDIDDSRSLYGNLNYYWLTARITATNINVCWENPGAASPAWRAARQLAVESNWGRYARVNFNQWDACSPGDKGIRVVICSSSSQLGCDAYPQSQASSGRLGDGVINGTELNVNDNIGVTVHEFGHNLGFYHEEERPEYEGTATGPGDCAKQSWNNANPIKYGVYDKASIMSYCAPGQNLSPLDIASVQRSYGRRIDGSLVSPRGNCAASHYQTGSGDTVFMWDCDEAHDDQEWRHQVSTGDERYLSLNGGGGNFCMAPETAVNGSQVKLKSCNFLTDWVFEEVLIRGFGGLCLDLQNGNTNNGTPIQMWECGALSSAYQKWSLAGNGQIRYKGLNSNKCARLTGGKLVLWDCLNSSDQLFTFAQQSIRTGNQCLDVYGPSDSEFINGKGLPANGNIIQAYSCNTAMNQKWNVTGPIRYGAARNLCLARDSTNDGNGTRVKVSNCSTGSAAQIWDYYL